MPVLPSARSFISFDVEALESDTAHTFHWTSTLKLQEEARAKTEASAKASRHYTDSHHTLAYRLIRRLSPAHSKMTESEHIAYAYDPQCHLEASMASKPPLHTSKIPIRTT